MKLKNKILSSMLVGAALMVVPSCTDTWDEHYDGNYDGSAVNAPSLLSQVESDADLSNFLTVLRHTGYDKVLDSPQALTLWAPVISADRAKALCDAFDAEKSRGIKTEDNTVIIQFVKNHLALYNHSVAASQADTTIKMLNGKYLVLGANALGENTFLKKNIVAKNGIFYKVGAEQTFHPNVREMLESKSEFDSIANFIKTYDEYTLNELQSVPKGIEDGKMVYADSVLNLSNTLLGRYGYIQREDSSYLLLAPTNEVWKAELERNMKFFNYVSYESHRDSLQLLNARSSIIMGRFFNKNTQKSEQDSLCNTMHINSSYYWGLNMFERPYDADGILGGLTPMECSNGEVYTDAKGNIDPRKTFMEARYIMATRNFTVPQTTDGSGQATMVLTPRSTEDTLSIGDKFYDFSEIKNDIFMEVANVTASSNAEIYYELPNTFSGVYYNVYAVMCPAIASNPDALPADTLPVCFQVYFTEKLDKARTNKNNPNDPNEDLQYAASWGSALDRAPLAEAFASSRGGKYFETLPNQVNIICIDQARKPNFSSYNGDGNVDPVLRYRIVTNVRANQLDRVYSNKLRINRLIYIPFETEEEANTFELSDLKDYQ